MMTTKKRVLIIGAGPAGLTAGYELLKHSDDYEVVIFEENDAVGGICRTIEHNGNLMDIGPHRHFSKVPEVNAWWENILPTQGQPAWDDIKLNRDVSLISDGPDPDTDDKVMLIRHRLTRILFNNKFYDYPISLKLETFKNMGLWKTILVGVSYLKAIIFKLPETNLENFYINRFGRRLYSMFFEYYTENLWGRHPREIDASWGAQRVKGLSIIAVLKNIFEKIIPNFSGKPRHVETSLIEQFKFPKLGAGELWEVTADEIRKMGGVIVKNAKVVGIQQSNNHATGLTYESDGECKFVAGDYVISSMPLKNLVAGINDVPSDVARIASGLPYRDYMILGVLIPHLKLKNQTRTPTISDIIPDHWIYVQDRNVKLGRFVIFNNWSPYIIRDLEHTVWLGLEYFVSEGDEFWNMSEQDFAKFGVSEMVKIGLIDSADDVLDTHLERVKKAYPAYFDTYNEIDTLVEYLSSIENLFCVGRNGQHRYNNIDHSMCTSFEAVKNILEGRLDKSNVWSVNTEKEYHETSK